jgi:UDP-N-acetylglucosamine transferase subunit ALG13
MASRRPVICLTGSGGGHVRQLLDLEPLWHDQHYFFVTEQSALTRTIAEKHPAHFVAHVALGQARLGAPIRMLVCGFRNMVRSLLIVLRERPDVVITTGAGSCFFTVFFSRLVGARVIAIDSFARFKAPSAFARIVSPLAHINIAQAPESAARWPGSHCFDPFRLVAEEPPQKEPLMFATVGATLPFDRLVRVVDKAKADGLIPENVILQTGIDGAVPESPDVVHSETLPFDNILDILRRADLVVCHGGTGSLITALREGCRVIAVPRRYDLGEHYDDHQVEVTRAFEARGLLSVAECDEAFPRALAEARARTAVRATTDQSEMIKFLRGVLENWQWIGRRRPSRPAGSEALADPTQ